LLEGDSNATDKGQAQYFTPVEWAAFFARPLLRGVPERCSVFTL
jgi:hypothetical protein